MSQRPPNSPSPAQHNRWGHAERLWERLLACDPWPQCDRWLAKELAQQRQYGKQDRWHYSTILFAAIRHAYFALFCQMSFETDTICLESFAQKIQTPASFFQALRSTPASALLTWVGCRISLDDTPPGQQVAALFASKAPTTTQQDFFARVVAHTTAPDLTKTESWLWQMLFHSVPVWVWDFFSERFSPLTEGTAALRFLQALDSKPPLWLRWNHAQHQASILEELAAVYTVTHTDAHGCAVLGQTGIFGLPCYQKGLIEIQDKASQWLGGQVAAYPGQMVWDCCAGGGGKTMQIASQLENKGVVYASDIRAYKLEEVKLRAKRAQFFNVRYQVWDGQELPPFSKEIHKRGGFDWVLVDSPCSSAGTWRRNPDAKYRLTTQSIDELTQLQLQILRAASRAVRLQGRLVYGTCSWLVRENEAVVQAFLQDNPAFVLCSQHLTGSPQDDSDTLFGAVLQRIAPNAENA